MKAILNEIIKGLLGTFTTKPDGWAARKVTAFYFSLLAGFIHYKFLSIGTAVEFLTIDCIVILLCLAIVTAEHVIELKHGKKEEPKE